MRLHLRCLAVALAFVEVVLPVPDARAASPNSIQTLVDRAVRPIMKQYGIPGMAIGITIDGRHDVFNYGVSSKATGARVDDSTLFEIGSVTKTFTAALVSYAAVTGKLALSDRVSADLPALGGTSFDRIRLLDLGTHTAGGLPLQFPDDVRTDSDAIRYYQGWKPAHDPGTYRLYANTGTALLGLVAANRLRDSFASSMQRIVLRPLGLRNTYITIPADKVSHYAQGYTGDGKPKRMSPGPLAAETYGIRSTASDVLRFVDANMGILPVGNRLRTAIVKTHTGYYQLGAMTQDLIWEQYRYPAPLPVVLQGNSKQVNSHENPVRAIRPPQQATDDAFINKTGSTGGFGAYVAFVPKRRIGVVLLANQYYPIDARVRLAYELITGLSAGRSAAPSTRDASAIAALERAFAIDLHAKNVSASVTLFAPDAVFIDENGRRVFGRQDIRNLYERVAANFDSDLVLVPQRSERAGPASATEFGRWRERLRDRKAGRTGTYTGRYTFQFIRSRGAWVFSRMQWWLDRPPKA